MLTYVTGRGSWYHVSWNGIDERSGGLAMNIGVHFFDLLLRAFDGDYRSGNIQTVLYCQLGPLDALHETGNPDFVFGPGPVPEPEQRRRIVAPSGG